MFKRVATLAFTASLAAAAAESIPSGGLEGNPPPDAEKNFSELCAENGFSFEEHTVTTKDGYILSLYRIPGQVTDDATGKPPVLMMHGVGDAAYAWVMHYADVAPAFVAARSGYDVWLGNSRGNTFSRKHTTLDPKSKEYWNFDWQEMGTGDLPAFIDYILDDTK